MGRNDHLEWPFFEEHHRRLRRDLEEWVNKRNPQAEDVETLCRSWVKELAGGGWLRHVVPERWGGVGRDLDVRSLCLIREALARHDPLADFAFAMQGLGSATLTLFGSDEQRRAWLPQVAAGRRIAAFALSEPQAGSDVAALTTCYRQEGEELVLQGTKTWISNAGIADYYIVFARAEGSRGRQGISAILVEASAAGLEVVERIRLLAPHPLGRLRLEDCRVPRAALIGEEGRGMRYALATLDVFRPTVGAAALGLARRAAWQATGRTLERRLFGSPMADLQLVQAKIADMELAIDAAALLVYRAAWLRDQGSTRVTREAAMAKLYATEAAQKVIDEAVQIFGAQGLVGGSVIEGLYRHVRALRIYEGASEVQRLIIARQALERRRKEEGKK